MKKLRIHVQGRVQGVGFRYTTKMLADQLGVTGSVKNEADGSVSIEAMAMTKPSMPLLLGLSSPSPAGKVNQIDIQPDDAIKERRSFDVVYY